MHLFNFIFSELFVTLEYNTVAFQNNISFQMMNLTKIAFLSQYTEYKLQVLIIQYFKRHIMLSHFTLNIDKR